MQKNILLWCLLLLSAASLYAQVHERSLGDGFQSYPRSLRPMSGGRWMVGGRSASDPGPDTVYAAVLDASGQTLQRISLQIQGWESYHDCIDAMPLPDGGMAVLATAIDCDVTDFNLLTVLNPDGTKRWSVSTFDAGFMVPAYMAIAPDSNLFWMTDTTVGKYSISNGTLLWHTTIPDYFRSSYGLTLLPGTENLLLFSYDQLYQLNKTGPTNQPGYEIAQSWDFSGKWINGMAPAFPNYIYLPTYADTGIQKVYRVDLAGPVDSFSLPPGKWGGPVSSGSGLFWLEYQHGNNRILKTDLSLHPIRIDTIAGKYLEAYYFAAHGDTVAIAGQEYVGPPDDPYPSKQYQTWFRTQWGNASPATDGINVTALSGVQTEPVHVDAQGSYLISKGHFKIQIKNNGNAALHQIYLNTRFEPLYPYCAFPPSYRQHYVNLNLQPGDTQWLDVDSLGTFRQRAVPKQVCFWTSGPNGAPDLDHSDDITCVDLATATTEPVAGMLIPYPNPADAGFTVDFPEGDAGAYRLFDCTGRLVLTGFDQGPQPKVSTQALPNGLYWLRIGTWSGKVVVQHQP